MYAQHCPVITAHGRSSPRGLWDVVCFVFATIQTPISRAPTVADDIREHGAASRYLSEHKSHGIAHLRRHRRGLHTTLERASGCPVSTVDALLTVPGLGLVKAAFAAQLLGEEVGCVDRHNMTLYSVPQSAVRFSKSAKRETRLSKIEAYVSLCAHIGGSEFMWDEWVAYVAGSTFNRSLPTAELVSAAHITGCNAA